MSLTLLNLSQPVTLFAVFECFAFLMAWQSAMYFLFTVPLYRRFWLAERPGDIRLRDEPLGRGQIRREIGWSMASIAVYSATMTLILLAWRGGAFPKFMVGSLERGWGKFFLGVWVLLAVQDAFFYVFHRLLHTRALMRFHKIHHRSIVPTPFAMHSFHPVEAVLQFVHVPLAMMLFPVGLWTILFSVTFMSNALNVYGHLGFEFQRPRWARWVSPRVLGTSVAHNHHHLHFNWNFCLYVSWLDWIFGTHMPDTDETMREIFQTGRIEKSLAKAAAGKSRVA